MIKVKSMYNFETMSKITAIMSVAIAFAMVYGLVTKSSQTFNYSLSFVMMIAGAANIASARLREGRTDLKGVTSASAAWSIAIIWFCLSTEYLVIASFPVH